MTGNSTTSVYSEFKVWRAFTSSTCVPARTAVMTGKRPAATGERAMMCDSHKNEHVGETSTTVDGFCGPFTEIPTTLMTTRRQIAWRQRTSKSVEDEGRWSWRNGSGTSMQCPMIDGCGWKWSDVRWNVKRWRAWVEPRYENPRLMTCFEMSFQRQAPVDTTYVPTMICALHCPLWALWVCRMRRSVAADVEVEDSLYSISYGYSQVGWRHPTGRKKRRNISRRVKLNWVSNEWLTKTICTNQVSLECESVSEKTTDKNKNYMFVSSFQHFSLSLSLSLAFLTSLSRMN